jgi:hypothetical protein
MPANFFYLLFVETLFHGIPSFVNTSTVPYTVMMEDFVFNKKEKPRMDQVQSYI